MVSSAQKKRKQKNLNIQKKQRLHEYYEQQRTLKVHKEKRLANEAILEEEYRAIVAGLLLFPFLASLFLSKQWFRFFNASVCKKKRSHCIFVGNSVW